MLSVQSGLIARLRSAPTRNINDGETRRPGIACVAGVEVLRLSMSLPPTIASDLNPPFIPVVLGDAALAWYERKHAQRNVDEIAVNRPLQDHR